MNNISEDESEIQVYRCMLCGTQYKEMPQNKFCKVCGKPLNSRQTKIVYNKIENGILIKISDEAALKSMNAGQFWFQSPRYYQEFKDNDAVGDINECAIENILEVSSDELKKYMGLSKGTLIHCTDGKDYILEKVLNGKVYVSSRYQNCYRLLCFYTLHISDSGKIVKPDIRMKNMGTHFSIVKNRKRFVQILNNYVKKEVESRDSDISVCSNWINYISDAYTGIYTPVCKFDKYSYQNEYRCVLSSNEYGKLPEKKEKRIQLDAVADENIMTPPIPLEWLWKVSTLDELSKI